MRSARLLTALAASAAVIATAPVIDVLRAALRAALPVHFSAVLSAIILGVGAVAVMAAAARIRGQRRWRVGALAASVALGVVAARVVASGNPEVDAVERVHFLEYGALAVLFLQVWRDRGDRSTLYLPLAAGLSVGLLDELVQWFIPGRVGEAHDVFIDGLALGCGLLFGLGMAPPPRWMARTRDDSRRLVQLGASGAGLLLVAFVALVHVGVEIRDAEGHVFRSSLSAAALRTAAADRADRWRRDPPTALRRVSREDRFLSEAWWHVQARNRAVSRDLARAAWGENRILEQFYAPVLDTPSYLSATGHRWSADMRAAAFARTRPGTPYRSDANPYPIYVWPRPVLWLVAGGLAVGLVSACGRILASRRGAPGSDGLPGQSG